MEGSILNTIKQLLGIQSDYTAFDADIVIHINSAFMALNQLGVGPTECFSIDGSGENWAEFVDKSIDLEAVKTYIYLKVRTIFDPPSSSVVMEAMNKNISELEWRLNVQVEK